MKRAVDEDNRDFAITFKLAQLMGGSVSAASKLGTGSSFTLMVPDQGLGCQSVAPGAVAQAAYVVSTRNLTAC